jgi:RimJ/RimL family protein N-acetyltransferase
MTIKLRHPNDGDAVVRRAYGYHPDILIGYGIISTEPTPMTLDEAVDWVSTLKNNPHAWIIESEGRLVGAVHLHGLDETDRRAALAIGLVDPSILGKGVGTLAIRACLAIAFDELKLHRISLRVLERNVRARRCYEKCGFKVEGMERQSALIGGRYENDVIMGVLETER